MFLVERELAAAVGGRVAAGAAAADRPRRCTISTSGVNRTRRPRARIAAQKSTSSVYMKIALVEQADRLGIGPPHEQAGAADPVGTARGASSLDAERLDVGRVAPHRRFCRISFERTDHPAERQLGVARSPSTSRGPTTAASGSALELGRAAGRWRPAARWCRCSAAASGRRCWRGCRCCSRARSRGWSPASMTRTPGQRRAPLGAAVGGRVVDDDDLVRRRGGAACSDARQRSRSARAL